MYVQSVHVCMYGSTCSHDNTKIVKNTRNAYDSLLVIIFINS